MKQTYDIFISYRREGGFDISQAIYQRLINDGYAAFLDLEQLKSGKFNTALLSVIGQCQDFLLILPPKALDRCQDENDWVRQEIEHALKTGKNIIPVMLRGFEWPAVETLPPSLRDLPMYHGISATDHNLFTENIERLKKKFLMSKPGFTWRRYKHLLIPLLVLLAVAGGWFIGDRMSSNKAYEQLCQTYVSKLMTGMMVMHHNYELSKNGYVAWEDFVKEQGTIHAADAQERFAHTMENTKTKLKTSEEIVVSEADAKLFRRHGIEIAEIEAMPMMTQMYHDEVAGYFDNLKLLSEQRASGYLEEQAALQCDFLKLSLQSNYYGLLALLSTMPDSVEEQIRKIAPELSFLSTTPISLSYNDYEMMLNGTMNELEAIVGKMNQGVNELQMDAEALEYKKERIEEELSNAYTDARLQNIEDKKVAVAKRRAELAEADQKLTELYNMALEKFALLPTDDQGTMWGKILRLAKLAENALKAEQEEKERHEELVAVARARGIDTDFLIDTPHTITTQEKFNNVDKWLVQYEQFNPGNEVQIADYVKAARAYYKAVAKGTQDPAIGVLLVGTLENQPHPQFRVGDIVIERKGKTVHTVQDYIDLKDAPGENQLRVLRFENGTFKTLSFIVDPDCPVLIGLSELHEI